MRDFFEFIRSSARAVLRGSPAYYKWVAFLLAWIALGVAAYVNQLRHGLAVTAMTDQVSWGVYIANFTYLVGVAAAVVMLVIPSYIYKDHALDNVVILGQLLALTATVLCLLFVTVDIGRPDRFWHLIPGLGRLNWPISMLAWDVIVINGYLVLNGFLTLYLLFTKFRGRVPDARLSVPLFFVMVGWAVGLHSVTAFLYSGLGARPYWNAAVLAPRFLASAFAAGPALMIVAFSLVRDWMGYPVPDAAIFRLRQIAAVAMLINLDLFGSEIFTELYTATLHAAPMRYLLFGLHGHHALVPYIWSAMALDVFAAIVFMTKALYKHTKILMAASCAAVVGVWIEKGMGLVIPGFVPTPLGEVVDYSPSFTEFCVSAGIWAIGALIFTALLKAAVPVELGQARATRLA